MPLPFAPELFHPTRGGTHVVFYDERSRKQVEKFTDEEDAENFAALVRVHGRNWKRALAEDDGI